MTIYNGAIIWVPTPASTAPAVPAASPSALAAVAVRTLALPSPVIDLSPGTVSVVNLATWLWVDQSSWHAFTATATAGAVSATATAVPTSVAWSMGNGQSTTCLGPGVPYQPDRPANEQWTDCSFTYQTSSAGQPSPDGDPDSATFTVTATIRWRVTWTATGAVGGGALPSLFTSSTARVRVEQIESIGTVS